MNPELWHTHPLLAWASVAPVPLGILWMLVGLRAGDRFCRIASPLTWFATRVLFAVVLWGLLGHPGVDYREVFLVEARWAMAGLLPYRDFRTAYAPLFTPLLALTMRILGTAGPMVLFLASDCIAWIALAVGLGISHKAVWVYASWPAVWYLAVRYAQDEPLAAMFVALAWLASRRGRHTWAGLILGLGMVTTKAIFLLPALPVIFGSGRSWARILAGFAVPVVAVYGIFIALGAYVMQPLKLEGRYFGAGPTLWAIPGLFGRWDPGLLGWVPFLVVFGAGTVILIRRSSPAEQHSAWGFGAFAALSPKFMNMYAIQWAPLLAVWGSGSRNGRAWLIAEGLFLPMAWYMNTGPLQGFFGPAWHLVATVALTITPLLALVPLVLILVRRDSGTPDQQARRWDLGHQISHR